MTSFFSSIQHWFKGDLYGRHLGLILQEIGRRRPKALTEFIGKLCDIPARDLQDATFQCEYTFQGTRGRRRADLALFADEQKIEPLVLIEIKYNDKPHPETETKPAQLADYQAWRNRDPGNRHVILLTRELHQVSDIHVQRWSALARHLRRHADESDLVAMLVQYLEEEGNAVNNINGAAITKYIKRYLCHGKFGANNIDGPLEFANLLKNMQLMSSGFHTHFKDAWREAGVKVEGEDYDRRSKIASIDFDVCNRLRAPKNSQAIIDADGWLREELKDGGSLAVFARHSLGHDKNWLRVIYGIVFDVTPTDNEADPPDTALYVKLCGGAIADDILLSKKINFDWVTKKAEMRAEKVEYNFHALIVKLIDKAAEEKVTLLPQQKKALSLLKKSLCQSAELLAEEDA